MNTAYSVAFGTLVVSVLFLVVVQWMTFNLVKTQHAQTTAAQNTMHAALAAQQADITALRASGTTFAVDLDDLAPHTLTVPAGTKRISIKLSQVDNALKINMSQIPSGTSIASVTRNAASFDGFTFDGDAGTLVTSNYVLDTDDVVTIVLENQTIEAADVVFDLAQD